MTLRVTRSRKRGRKAPPASARELSLHDGIVKMVRKVSGPAKALEVSLAMVSAARELEREERDALVAAQTGKRTAKATERWRDARRIMGGCEVSPVTFIRARRPGWQELGRLYGEVSGVKMPNTTRAKMLRDWNKMKGEPPDPPT